MLVEREGVVGILSLYLTSSTIGLKEENGLCLFYCLHQLSVSLSFLSFYDTVSVFPSISLSALSHSLQCSPHSACTIYQSVSLSHVCCPCQQNGWQTIFISTLRDARTAWQLWELSTGIRQNPPHREVATACLSVFVVILIWSTLVSDVTCWLVMSLYWNF